MKEVYIVATASAKPVTDDMLKEAFESEEIKLVLGEEGCLFSVRAESTRIDVRFRGAYCYIDVYTDPGDLPGRPPTGDLRSGDLPE